MTKKIAFLTVAALCFSVYGEAVIGNTYEGYGAKSRGMGGVGIALPQDSLAAAMNPAGMVHVGNRFDLGISWLPYIQTKLSIKGNPVPTNNCFYKSTPDVFIPDAGYNKMISDCVSLGVSVWGRGSSNLFGERVGGNLYGSSNLSSTLIIAYATPTIAWKINNIHSLGFGIDLALGRTKNKGFQSLKQNSIHPNHVTNKGYDFAPGAGFHIGWLGKITHEITLGASYQSPTWQSKFRKYTGLFPNSGKVTIPSNFGFGISYLFNPCLTFSADVRRFLLAKERAFGNRFTMKHLLGSKKGTGLGWRSSTTFRFGIAYQFNDHLTIRSGYVHNSPRQIPKSQLFNNVNDYLLSTDLLTFGATWHMACHEFDFFYQHGFKNQLRNKNAIPAAFGGGEMKASLTYDWIGISYGQRF